MVPHGVERKLTAILSADVKGYSRLMGDEEVATIRTLTAYREVMASLIQQHRGRVIDTVGDNLLAEFASVVDAVQCAVEIQRELTARNADLPDHRKMQFRIGINLGDVVVEGERIYGDGVNIAARVEGIAEGAGICVSGTVYDQVENKLALGYAYLGEHAVKNIRKPVRVYRVLIEPDEVKKAVITETTGLPLPDEPSIAVLPFENLSGDPEQLYFADGIVEDIITALSRFPYIFVIARNTSFTFKGRSVDVRQVARELGVRYVLEGSVRKVGNHIRITAQLVDGTTGNHIWAERYDRGLVDVFAVQDDITERVVGAIQPEVYTAEVRRAERKPAENLDIWNYTVRGRWHVWRLTREDNVEAKQLLGRALDLDPNYVPALAFLAYSHLVDVFFGWSAAPPQSIGEAGRLAQRAASLDENDPWVQCALGLTRFVAKDPDTAIAHYQKAIDLNSSFALAHGYLSLQLAYAGEPEAALEEGHKAIRLSPHDPELFHFHVAVGTAHFVAERYDEAVAWANKVMVERPETPAGHRLLAASFAQSGRTGEAQRALEGVLRITPHLTATLLRNIIYFKRPTDFDRYIDGLRKAGLPD